MQRTMRAVNARGRPEREAMKSLVLGGINGRSRKTATELLVALGYVVECSSRYCRDAYPIASSYAPV